jgi:hypothetical protein
VALIALDIEGLPVVVVGLVVVVVGLAVVVVVVLVVVVELAVVVEAEQPSHFSLHSTQASGVPKHALFLKQRPLRFPYGPFLEGSLNSTLHSALSFGAQL